MARVYIARKLCGLAALILATTAIIVATASAQNPALVPQGSRTFTPPDTPAPPPRAASPAQQAPPQNVPSETQGAQIPAPTPLGMAAIAPAPLLQKPAVPPVVNMQNGLLSIDAANSNLSDVLNAVKHATGATIEGGSGATDRVVVHLGPGRPNDVISTLLTGSRYDYVLLGSAQQPGAVTRIMLSLRQGGDQGSSPQAASNVPPQASNNQGNPDEEGPQEDTPEQREQDARQPEPPPAAPQGSPEPGQPPQNAQQPGTANDNQTRTPQQLFEEIQRMQQMRQQDQQNQQNQPNQQNQQQYPPPPQ
ncbi:MAG TPA: hypothetical protein VMT82_01870 [candidate division Zixibacteria bacterium]|nr:hypothetical protein [candidate division Zixibacteria bacterium]